MIQRWSSRFLTQNSSPETPPPPPPRLFSDSSSIAVGARFWAARQSSKCSWNTATAPTLQQATSMPFWYIPLLPTCLQTQQWQMISMGYTRMNRSSSYIRKSNSPMTNTVMRPDGVWLQMSYGFTPWLKLVGTQYRVWYLSTKPLIKVLTTGPTQDQHVFIDVQHAFVLTVLACQTMI